MRAPPPVLALLAVALAATACDRGAPPAGSATNVTAGARPAFESRCAALPGTTPAVTTEPIVPVQDETRSLAELTALYERASPLHRTMGLTQSRMSYASSLEAAGLADAGRVCMRVRVTIEVSASPVTVFIAREVAADPCRRAAVHDHEMRHVSIHATFLEDARARLLASLVAKDVGRLRFATNADALQQDAAAEVSALVAAAEAADRDILSALQAAIDTPEEYARVGALCDTALVAVPPDRVRPRTDRR